MNILLSGGAGYIGSHVAAVLVEAGHHVVILDNLSNSELSVLERLHQVTSQKIPFIQADTRDTDILMSALRKNKIDAVMHFAGLKAVGESVSNPIDYYDNNVSGTISLLNAMHKCNVKTLIFSSSATVYGEPQYLPYDEKHPTRPYNPYGRTKLHIEELLSDIAQSDNSFKIVCLRYFNPVGAHETGLIGENPSGIPNNLMPYIVKVAKGQLPNLNIFGDDYETPDGTCVRDYIHVMDLAEGHLAALNFLANHSGWHAINLGAGKGYSVFDVVQTFQKSTGIEVPYQIISRRAGDIAYSYADVKKAHVMLNWSVKRELAEMCSSAFNYAT
ncbi:MAG: UDP-glucose 4-epimerase GalE [Methylotenera sp. 17-45-7]|nr:MAG: UDP-glucose 4-epimerase GalE [Methylotenera sp. 17-45-7]